MKSFSQIKGRSAEYARNRIKLLLVSERIDCSPQMISMLKNDLIHTVKKYISIDEKQVTVQITQEPPVIHAKIPVMLQKGTKDKMLKQYKLRFYNFRLVIFLLAISVIGIVLWEVREDLKSKQLVGVILGLIIMVILSLMDYSWISNFQWIMYGFNLLMLIGCTIVRK